MKTRKRPWYKLPGECLDKNGYPIYPGDLLRTFHFVGARRKKYYLYHVAVLRDGAMRMVPTCHLEPTFIKSGGDCLLDDDLAKEAEIITGHGPGEIIDYCDRPRRKQPQN